MASPRKRSSKTLNLWAWSSEPLASEQPNSRNSCDIGQCFLRSWFLVLGFWFVVGGLYLALFTAMKTGRRVLSQALMCHFSCQRYCLYLAWVRSLNCAWAERPENHAMPSACICIDVNTLLVFRPLFYSILLYFDHCHQNRHAPVLSDERKLSQKMTDAYAYTIHYHAPGYARRGYQRLPHGGGN